VAERKANGEFAKGNQVAKGHDGSKAGRPPRAIEEAYLHTVQAVMPTERWERCCEAYAVKAEGGDRYAFAFFANYLMGKPIEHKEHAGEVTLRVIREDAGIDRADEDAPSETEAGGPEQGQTEDSQGG